MRVENNPGYSIHQAYAWMLETLKKENRAEFDKIRNNDNLIILDDFGFGGDAELEEEFITRFSGSGYVIGFPTRTPGDNTNQVQSQVKDEIVKGDKKWETAYVAVFDHPWGNTVVPGSRSGIKKEAVDAAKAMSAMYQRDAFVIIGRKPIGFSRVTAQVLYKPSQNQQTGLYTFVW